MVQLPQKDFCSYNLFLQFILSVRLRFLPQAFYFHFTSKPVYPQAFLFEFFV